MNVTAHNCPDCGSLLIVDDTIPDDLTFECPDCFSTFGGHVDTSCGGFAYVLGASA
jgi:predicted RNA-binding Zn-ribbon protein involved in translation (DUF1610 family)